MGGGAWDGIWWRSLWTGPCGAGGRVRIENRQHHGHASRRTRLKHRVLRRHHFSFLLGNPNRQQFSFVVGPCPTWIEYISKAPVPTGEVAIF